MPLPTYQLQNNQQHPDKILSGGAHAGLWFDKFFQDYNYGYSDIKNENRQIFIDLAKKYGDSAKIKKQKNRLMQLVKAKKGIYTIFSTNWNFITGMGQNHAIENGFSWHPTLSTPFVSGASVKGLLRHWMKYYQTEDYIKIANLWFGNESTNQQTQQAGKLIFLDAIPTEPTTIVEDIMTPHYGEWYSKGQEGKEEDAPHDSHEPVPISFLAVKKASFLFSIMPTNSQDQLLQDTAKEAMEQLSNALKYLGAGAKTAAGYGRMIEDIEATAQSSQENLEQNKSEKIKEMDKLTKELKAQKHAAGSKPMIEAFDFLKIASDSCLNWTTDEQNRLKEFFTNYPVSKKKSKDTDYKAMKAKISKLK